VRRTVKSDHATCTFLSGLLSEINTSQFVLVNVCSKFEVSGNFATNYDKKTSRNYTFRTGAWRRSEKNDGRQRQDQ